MNHRLVRCRACRTTFLADDDPAVRSVDCPKCGARTAAPSEVETEPEPGPTVFVAASEGRRNRRFVRPALFVLAALVVAATTAAVVWPSLRSRMRPVPVDPIESAATSYLQALAAGDAETAGRLGTIDLPPAIRSFRAVRRDRAADLRLKGSFAPIATLHVRIDERFTLDPASGRYAPRDALGPAAEVLDALHAAKAEAEKSDLYKKMQSGDPNDIFDAAESFGKTFADLAGGVLAPKRLIPSYKQLVEDAEPPLPAAERTLAIDYAEHRATWDALLKRPFATLKADGPFLLERAEATAAAIDALGSLGDPPTTIRLTLTRFRLEGIDTGWRVTSARRESAADRGTVEPSDSAENRR